MSVKGIEWVKLAVDTFEDEKVKLIRSMPDGDTMALVWVQLICHAGKVNGDGVVRIAEGLTYSDEMLATVLGHPIGTVRLAINTFARFGMVSVDDEGIWLTNWDRYQNIDGMARIREQTRMRVSRHREKVKLLTAPVTLPVTLRNATEEDKELDKDIDTTKATAATRTESSVTQSLITELSRLEGWGRSSSNHDSDWLSEFTAEFPALTVSHLRACRDYHADKRKHTKGYWKLRLRHWMEREAQNNGNNGRNERRGSGARSLPARDEYEPAPVYTRPNLRE